MIKIKKSLTADTRSCDFKDVTEETLYASTRQHISDVGKALDYFRAQLHARDLCHDNTKKVYIKEFHEDFVTGFEKHSWWDKHKASERHHLAPECVGETVNLIDILEHIADCVAAGMARTGKVFPIKLDNEMLQKAVENTVNMLISEIEVED